MTDADWMRRALALAERGRGAVEPNPMVGAVVTRGGAAVGEGWHERYGGPHAEVHALAAAGDAARGATIYVTLEPCCHHGKTPPCTDAVLRAGVARVVAAMADPFPEVAGGGLARLRAAGVAVEVGVGEAEARRLNAPYLKLVGTGRPWVVAKWAMTLDGKIATASGDSKWISSEASRQLVHGLRGRVDAVVVGAGTVRADDPLLTARPPGPRTATRVVLTRSGELPADCALLRTARDVPVLVAAPAERPAWAAAGCEFLAVPEGGEVEALLAELGRRRFTNVLIEGGAGVHGAFLDAGAADEVWAFVAPKLLGGTGPGPVAGRGADAVAAARPLAEWRWESVGGDLWVCGRVGERGRVGGRD